MNQYSELPADIDPATVRRIATDYGLDGDVLVKRLSWAAFSVPMLRDFRNSEPTTKEVKRHIEGMRNAAATLTQQIDRLPASSFRAELFYKYKKLYMLNADLAELITALDNLDPLGWKENGDQVGRDVFIQQIATLWKSETGKRPTESEKPGQFLAFMAECAYLFGIDPSPLPGRFRRLRKQSKGTDFEI